MKAWALTLLALAGCAHSAKKPEAVALVQYAPETVASWPKDIDDTLKAPLVRRFLSELGITKPQAVGDLQELDLSERFKRPRRQGRTNAGSAFAALSDLETFPGVPLLSAHDLYAAAQAIEASTFERLEFTPKGLWAQGNEPFIETLKSREAWSHYEPDLDQGMFHVETPFLVLEHFGVVREKDDPWEYGFDRDDLQPQTRRHRFRAKGHARMDLGLLPAADRKKILHALIAVGQPPIAVVNRFHFVNVVGYGFGKNQTTGGIEAQFIVRDSLSRKPTHNRVSAEDFAASVTHVLKISGVR